MTRVIRRRSILPGRGLTLGFATAYLSVLVIMPLAALILRAASLGPAELLAAATTQRALFAYRLTLWTSFIAATLNAVFGMVVAWVLTRYSFPGRRLLDALVDLPFALPTAVAGLALTSLFATNGWVGKPLANLGIKVAFTPLGIVVALTFIGLPFVVRTLQPVLESLDPETEEAAASLGASRGTTFLRVVLPLLVPAWLTGFALAFARALGEYGSVIFIAGNLPLQTEIAPLVIMTRLEQYDYGGAAAVGVALLLMSFVLLATINALQSWSARRMAAS